MGARASRVWGVGGRARGRSPSGSTTRLARDGEPPPQQQLQETRQPATKDMKVKKAMKVMKTVSAGMKAKMAMKA